MNPVARQSAVVLACTFGLLQLLAMLNSQLAPWHISLNLSGLLIAFAALRLHPRAALPVVFAIGLFIDADAPVFFGQSALLLCAFTCVLLGIRHRLPKEETSVGVAIAIILNLLFFVLRTFLHAPAWSDPLSGWLRIFTDLLASQLVIVLIAPWFFALQQKTLAFLGVSPAMVENRF